MTHVFIINTRNDSVVAAVVAVTLVKRGRESWPGDRRDGGVERREGREAKG